ncbi:MAG: single-stranded-DNA-specific exonuclease [Bacillota bacterium]|nr:single-stranded-DNA-specific exonuclease [Bacillota bacterium]MDK2926047.1 single-stranded-DNA-specific exonuclease [Bacillota bacterium]MDK2960017.1 single-stranded-DNA-specific exonuclease [Bacillota bacterium]
MKRWKVAPRCARGAALKLSHALGISPLLATLLIQRGYTEVEAARRFLRPELSDLHSPFAFRSMEKAVERLSSARRLGERVGIFGDYDVDGITSTALLVKALSAYGLDVVYRLPERLTEGYGLSRRGLEELIDRGVQLLVTVDCGITAREEVAWAKSRGVDTIVCDHHLPPEGLPPAVAILDPKLPAEGYPFPELAGVGVALKLAQALTGRLEDGWLELAALGTVADVAPLTGENRTLVYYGLKAMRSSSFPGLRALLALASLNPDQLGTGQISFRLAPRLNALGRLGDATPGVELFLTSDEDQAYELALLLENENRRRQQVEEEVLVQAVAQVEKADLEDERALVVAGEGWHPGVIGIVAARLVEKWQRPALVISLNGEEGKGSGRSIPAFSLYEGLKKTRRWLKEFGGHQLAAGFSLARADLPAFREAFLAVARSSLRPEDLISSQAIDAEVKLAELDLDAVAELGQMAPFGRGNPEPTFLVRDLVAARAQAVGQAQEHLRLELVQGDRRVGAIGFGLGNEASLLAGNRLDVLFYPEINEWQGLRAVELRIKDLAAATDPAEICCQAQVKDAPCLHDFRGKETCALRAPGPGSGAVVLEVPPESPAYLLDQLRDVPPGGSVWLTFGPRELERGRRALAEYPDRDFLARLYLSIKAAGGHGATAGSLSLSLGVPVAKVRWGLIILEELALVVRKARSSGGEQLYRLRQMPKGQRVDLHASRTFRNLERERRQRLAFQEFLARASGPVLAHVVGCLWERAHKMTKTQVVC